MKLSTASASAKIILFGEHAVVHGRPALATPVSTLRVNVKVQPQSQINGIILIADDIKQRYHITQDNIVELSSKIGPIAMISQMLELLEIDNIPSIRMSIQSSIPVASGLGSGAAVSTAIGRAMFKYAARPIDDSALSNQVYHVEQLYHGNPSGIDNTVIVYEKPVFFRRDSPIQIFSFGQPVRMIIADTGIAAPTHKTVHDVGKLIETDPDTYQKILDKIALISNQARTALVNGNVKEVGILMIENHNLLRELTVSSAQLDRMVNNAVTAGALGAKLSGGGRGGNMIALVKEWDETATQVSEALRQAGAINVVRTTIG